MQFKQSTYKDLNLPRKIKATVGRKGNERIVVMDLSNYKILFQGLDALHIVYSGRLRYDWWQYEKLKEKKLMAQAILRSGKKNDGPLEIPFVTIDNQLWEVSPIGTREYAYCLLRNGWRVYLLSNRGLSHPIQVKIEVPSSRLRMGINGQNITALKFELSQIAFTLIPEREEFIQRVDLTVDVEGFQLSSLKDLVFCGYPKKAKMIDGGLSNSQFVRVGDSAIETFVIGKNPQLRIYDKLAKSLKDDPDWFENWYGKSRETVLSEVGNDKRLLKPITRFEFQLRSNVLKELGITFYESLLEKTQGVWDYLTSQWLDCKKVVPEIKNNKNLPTAGVWIFLRGVRFGKKTEVTREKAFSYDSKRNYDQLLGHMTAICAKDDLKVAGASDEEKLENIFDAIKHKMKHSRRLFPGKLDSMLLKKRVRYQDWRLPETD